MCEIVAVRGGQAANEVLRRLASAAPQRPVAVAELGGGRSLHAPQVIEPREAPQLRRVRAERGVRFGRLAIGCAPYTDRCSSWDGVARPQSGGTDTVMVVHCGSIDNADNLRRGVESAGHVWSSTSDGALIAHLLEIELTKDDEAFTAFQAAIGHLRGSWAIAALIARHNAIYVARNRHPLAIRGTIGRFVVATDPTCMNGLRGPLRILEDGSIAELGTTWRWAGTPGRPPPPTAGKGPADWSARPNEADGVRCTLQRH